MPFSFYIFTGFIDLLFMDNVLVKKAEKRKSSSATLWFGQIREGAKTTAAGRVCRAFRTRMGTGTKPNPVHLVARGAFLSVL